MLVIKPHIEILLMLCMMLMSVAMAVAAVMIESTHCPVEIALVWPLRMVDCIFPPMDCTTIRVQDIHPYKFCQ